LRWAGFGVARSAGGCGARLAWEIGAGDLQAVEKMSGALGVELIAGDEGENLGEGELDAVTVVEVGHVELVGGGMDTTVAGAGAAGGVVVVAELFAAQGGRAAAAAGGMDVSAEITLDGGLGAFCGFDCVGHGSLRWSGGVYPPEVT
jgi:hypothetical protein